jgi:16S rRNA (cytosine1402-N4)-methyltransferase
LPVELPGTGPTLRLLTRGAEQPSPAEVAANPRAASVRLRAAEHITDTPQDRDRAVRERPRRIKGLHQPGWRTAPGRRPEGEGT